MKERKTPNLKRLDEAAVAFYELKGRAPLGGESLRVPEGHDEHFTMAALAAAFLYSKGNDTLLQMETERRIHPSTITGSSLPVTVSFVMDYFLNDRRDFSRDNYEQLARTCQSVAELHRGERY